MNTQLCYTCKGRFPRENFNNSYAKQCEKCKNSLEKRCTMCNITKSQEEFPLMSGYRNSYCRMCRQQVDKEYRNRDEVKEKRRNRDKNYYKTFSDEKKEILRSRHRDWLKNNQQKSKDYSKDYRDNKGPALLVMRSNQSAKKKGSPFYINLKDWDFILKLFDYKCAASEDHIIDDNNSITLDHVNPMINNVEKNHSAWNIQPLCLRCNLKKGMKEIDFRDEEQIREIRKNCAEFRLVKR